MQLEICYHKWYCIVFYTQAMLEANFFGIFNRITYIDSGIYVYANGIFVTVNIHSKSIVKIITNDFISVILLFEKAFLYFVFPLLCYRTNFPA